MPTISEDSAGWEVYEVGPNFRRSRLEFEPGKFLIRTEYMAEDDLIDRNRELFNESQTKRFGDGQVVARIPLNRFFKDLAGKIKEGDDEHLRWWLNRDDAKPWRTFRGRL